MGISSYKGLITLVERPSIELREILNSRACKE